jgi:carboxylesterase
MNPLPAYTEIDMGEGDAGFILGSGAVGVLLIHGLTGTPTELRRVAQGLAERGCTVYVPTLAGHCGDNADLQRTRWSDWYESARRSFVGIRQRHRQVFVGGLSMGAVMSMHVAAQHPGQVAGLLLYSTTLRYDGWNIPFVAKFTRFYMMIPFGVHICRFNEKPPYGIKSPRLRAIVEKQMMDGESNHAGLLTISGVSLRELHRLIAVVKRAMPSVTTPALVLHSLEDDITSRWNADYVERKLGGPVIKVLLDNCYHMITVDLEYRQVIALSASFIETRVQALLHPANRQQHEENESELFDGTADPTDDHPQLA